MASIGDGYFIPGGDKMNAVTDIETARRLASVIEESEARRLGLPVARARARIARALGASPGTLENLKRSRLKSTSSWLMANIRAAFVRVLQSEIIRLEHEISVHLQAGADHRDDDLASAQTQIEAAKRILTAAVDR